MKLSYCKVIVLSWSKVNVLSNFRLERVKCADYDLQDNQ